MDTCEITQYVDYRLNSRNERRLSIRAWGKMGRYGLNRTRPFIWRDHIELFLVRNYFQKVAKLNGDFWRFRSEKHPFLEQTAVATFWPTLEIAFGLLYISTSSKSLCVAYVEIVSAKDDWRRRIDLDGQNDATLFVIQRQRRQRRFADGRVDDAVPDHVERGAELRMDGNGFGQNWTVGRVSCSKMVLNQSLCRIHTTRKFGRLSNKNVFH